LIWSQVPQARNRWGIYPAMDDLENRPYTLPRQIVIAAVKSEAVLRKMVEHLEGIATALSPLRVKARKGCRSPLL
jgi:hypothetical protein